MKHLNHYRDGLITIDEMVERELHDCQYDNTWLEDALDGLLSDNEYSRAYRIIDRIMRKRSMDRVLKK